MTLYGPLPDTPINPLLWIQSSVIDLIGSLLCSEVNKNLVFNAWVLGSVEVAIDSLKSLAPYPSNQRSLVQIRLCTRKGDLNIFIRGSLEVQEIFVGYNILH